MRWTYAEEQILRLLVALVIYGLVEEVGEVGLDDHLVKDVRRGARQLVPEVALERDRREDGESERANCRGDAQADQPCLSQRAQKELALLVQRDLLQGPREGLLLPKNCLNKDTGSEQRLESRESETLTDWPKRRVERSPDPMVEGEAKQGGEGLQRSPSGPKEASVGDSEASRWPVGNGWATPARRRRKARQ